MFQILFDFVNRFPMCDPDVFRKSWPEKSLKLQNILLNDYPSNRFMTLWPKEIESLFILLKLLPAKNGRNKIVDVFQKAIEKLIVFREVFGFKEELEKNHIL